MFQMSTFLYLILGFQGIIQYLREICSITTTIYKQIIGMKKKWRRGLTSTIIIFRSIFKSHSISVTFKFCTMPVAFCALEPCSTDSLGTQHRSKFESNNNRMTFEYATNDDCKSSSSMYICNECKNLGTYLDSRWFGIL